jgi:hypothetical protein
LTPFATWAKWPKGVITGPNTGGIGIPYGPFGQNSQNSQNSQKGSKRGHFDPLRRSETVKPSHKTKEDVQKTPPFLGFGQIGGKNR